MRWNRKRIAITAATLCGAVLLLLVIGWFAAPKLLVVETALESSDVILVLGGDPLYRPVQAADLYHRKFASKVFISGWGDCYWNSNRLVDYKVPAENIFFECESRNTKQNSEITIRWLRAHNVTKVIIVTSWFHSRRSFAVFQQSAPDIQFFASPSHRRLPRRFEVPYVFKEYLKIVYYWVRYGIRSFGL